MAEVHAKKAQEATKAAQEIEKAKAAGGDKHDAVNTETQNKIDAIVSKNAKNVVA